jgi:hypothetical protein
LSSNHSARIFWASVSAAEAANTCSKSGNKQVAATTVSLAAEQLRQPAVAAKF